MSIPRTKWRRHAWALAPVVAITAVLLIATASSAMAATIKNTYSMTVPSKYDSPQIKNLGFFGPYNVGAAAMFGGLAHVDYGCRVQWDRTKKGESRAIVWTKYNAWNRECSPWGTVRVKALIKPNKGNAYWVYGPKKAINFREVTAANATAWVDGPGLKTNLYKSSWVSRIEVEVSVTCTRVTTQTRSVSKVRTNYFGASRP